MDSLIASAISTTAAEILTLPICTLKTVYINNQNINPNQSLKSVIKDIYNQRGIRAFYAASLPAISNQVISSSTKYFGYRYFGNLLGNNTYLDKTRNSIFAGVLSSIITHPLDVIRIYIQMNDSLKNQIKQNGYKILYRGYDKTFTKVLIGSCTFFPLFDLYRELIPNILFKIYQDDKYNSETNISLLLSSLFSGITSTILMHPIDYLKTRNIYNLPLFAGFNPLLYYRGLSLNLLRIVPHFMIMMTLTEKIRSYISYKKE